MCIGTHGGMPIHHAAKRGLDKTVRVLLDNGGIIILPSLKSCNPYIPKVLQYQPNWMGMMVLCSWSLGCEWWWHDTIGYGTESWSCFCGAHDWGIVLLFSVLIPLCNIAWSMESLNFGIFQQALIVLRSLYMCIHVAPFFCISFHIKWVPGQLKWFLCFGVQDRICLFSGVVRELAGPGFLETLAPQWVTKKMWVNFCHVFFLPVCFWSGYITEFQ